MTAATSYMFVTGPNVVKQVLNETISPEELGRCISTCREIRCGGFCF